jgi:hypothetical protein
MRDWAIYQQLTTKESQTPRANQLNPPKTQSPVWQFSLTGKERARTLLSRKGESL